LKFPFWTAAVIFDWSPAQCVILQILGWQYSFVSDPGWLWPLWW
jgi:hypothetical protein